MILTAIIGGVFVIPAIIIACMAPFAPECPEGCDDCGRHR